MLPLNNVTSSAVLLNVRKISDLIIQIDLYVCVSQVVATFQRMRQEQRSMASKAAELEMEINEHRLVMSVS